MWNLLLQHNLLFILLAKVTEKSQKGLLRVLIKGGVHSRVEVHHKSQGPIFSRIQVQVQNMFLWTIKWQPGSDFLLTLNCFVLSSCKQNSKENENSKWPILDPMILSMAATKSKVTINESQSSLIMYYKWKGLIA